MLTIDTISAYNDLHGFKTQHPQVAFARFTPETKRSVEQYEFGLYALFLKETKGSAFVLPLCFASLSRETPHPDTSISCSLLTGSFPAPPTRLSIKTFSGLLRGEFRPRIIASFHQPDALYPLHAVYYSSSTHFRCKVVLLVAILS